METVRYTERYLPRAITANQNYFVNYTLKLCPYSANDGGMASLNMTHAQMKNCSLQGVITRTNVIVRMKNISNVLKSLPFEAISWKEYSCAFYNILWHRLITG